MGGGKISKAEIKEYLVLQRKIKENIERKIDLEKKFLSKVSPDGWELIGPYKVCHKTLRRKSVSWKGEYTAAMGQAKTDSIAAKAPLGEPTHRIEVQVKVAREVYDIPSHIPDEQVEDHISVQRSRWSKTKVKT